MKIFKIDKNLEVVCEYKNKQNGFKHEATLVSDGEEVLKTSCSYTNRTWESFEFQSVLKKLFDKAKKQYQLSNKATESFENVIENGGKDEMDGLKRVSRLTKLAGLFSGNLKESNKLQVRALKTQLGDNFSLPDNWDDLKEKEKARRLDKVLKTLSE